MILIFYYEYKLSLITMKDIEDFVKIANTLDTPLKLTDGKNYSVNPASLLGVMYSLEWNNLYLLSKEDVYSSFSKYIEHSRIKTTNLKI